MSSVSIAPPPLTLSLVWSRAPFKCSVAPAAAATLLARFGAITRYVARLATVVARTIAAAAAAAAKSAAALAATTAVSAATITVTPVVPTVTAPVAPKAREVGVWIATTAPPAAAAAAAIAAAAALAVCLLEAATPFRRPLELGALFRPTPGSAASAAAIAARRSIRRLVAALGTRSLALGLVHLGELGDGGVEVLLLLVDLDLKVPLRKLVLVRLLELAFGERQLSLDDT